MKRAFLSHINEDASLARKLKDWTEDAFVGQCEVFVSTDSRSLAPGARWLEEISEALSEASVLIVLCSPTSTKRPWVNFESGAGWAKQVPVVPICHSGLARSALPLPLSAFQAIELDASDFVPTFLAAMARHLGFPRAPRIDATAMQAELLGAIGSREEPPPEVEATSVAAALAPECIDVLSALVTLRDPTAADLARHFQTGLEKMRYFIDLLSEQDLIGNHLYIGSPATYYLSSKGRRHLVEIGKL